MKNVYSGPSEWDSSAFAVFLQNAWKSFTEPGSVAMTLRTCPAVRSPRTFLALRMGSGQLSPRTSSSRSKLCILFSERTGILTCVVFESALAWCCPGTQAPGGGERHLDGVRP